MCFPALKTTTIFFLVAASLRSLLPLLPAPAPLVLLPLLLVVRKAVVSAVGPPSSSVDADQLVAALRGEGRGRQTKWWWLEEVVVVVVAVLI